MPFDLLSTIRAEIVARLDELRPLILEYEQLLSASEALGRQGWAAPGSGASARSGLAPAASSSASARAGAAPSARGGPSAARATRSSGRRRRVETPSGERVETPSGERDRARAGSATGVSGRSASGSRGRASRPRRNEASAAILAALEHGSHTAAELTVVTGLSAAAIRRDLRVLLREGAISRTTRAGKTAYVLPA